MDITFWKGFFLGILIALPSGPVSFLIIRRIYLFGMKNGMYSVIGSLVTDIFYIVIVGFGLKTIERFLGMVSGYAEITASAIIIISGYRIFREKNTVFNKQIHHQHPVKSIFSIIFLNMLNPTLVFSFATLFLFFGLQNSIGNPRDVSTVIIGFTVGVLLFWYLLGKYILFLRRKSQAEKLMTINHKFGLLLVIIGTIMLFLAIVHILFPGFHYNNVLS